jgi:hypothetical protein
VPWLLSQLSPRDNMIPDEGIMARPIGSWRALGDKKFHLSYLFNQNFTRFLPLREHKDSISYLFSSDMNSLLSTEIHKSSRILRTRETYLRTKISLFFSSQQSQFQVPTTKPFVGIGADPGFNTSTMHQQKPNYRPFWKHL